MIGFPRYITHLTIQYQFINPNLAGNDMKDQIDILVSLQQIEIESSTVKSHLIVLTKKP